jgi:hypothetical protein
MDKAVIIVEFIAANLNDEHFEEFFDYHDLGVPMAVAFVNDFIKLTDKGMGILDETWADMCSLFGADPDLEYQDLEDLID